MNEASTIFVEVIINKSYIAQSI
uniref:Uncharacterized protein n=1 Tax=Lepeophtheirus salmonis TaxID=72036 RepID=A0A0K2UT83_LEPSM